MDLLSLNLLQFLNLSGVLIEIPNLLNIPNLPNTGPFIQGYMNHPVRHTILGLSGVAAVTTALYCGGILPIYKSTGFETPEKSA